MTDTREKTERELRIFREFVQRSSLMVDPDSVKSCDPPRPDISCEICGLGVVHFELVEICDEALAETISRQERSNSLEPEFVWLGDPIPRICRQKRRKNYKAEGPIDIVFYTAGRTAMPPDVIIPSIKRAFFSEPDPFHRVWLMAEIGEFCGCIIE